MATTQEQRDDYKRNKESKKTIEERLTSITDFCDRMSISYSINRNPSPEEIERIRGEVKRTEEIMKKKFDML